MEQFNLDKYLKNPNRKIITRDGRPVRIICINLQRLNRPIVAAILDNSDIEDICNYGISGHYCTTEIESSFDLFFKPIKRKGYEYIS